MKREETLEFIKACGIRVIPGWVAGTHMMKYFLFFGCDRTELQRVPAQIKARQQ